MEPMAARLLDGITAGRFPPWQVYAFALRARTAPDEHNLDQSVCDQIARDAFAAFGEAMRVEVEG